MKIIADLHIHSHHSRATSKALNFEHLNKWAQLKGVHVVGTGDITHPGWLQEMKDKLEPAEEGLFRLKDEYAKAVQADVPPACQAPVRFMLGGEISNIYKKYDKVRKVHNLIYVPDLAAVERLQAALEKIGNIRSDGRPILGLDSRDLLEIALETDPQAHFIPAHIWTPWFSMLGSKSGFDSVQECFADLTSHIFALETGLSSDPPMNWRVSGLDQYTLVSNSDAHSPPKLAREANLFDADLSYTALFTALKDVASKAFLGTIEFFPEEGKYHLDGHRKCGICWEPSITLAHDSLCPVCGKPVTVGVMHRVETLADRPEGEQPPHPRPFYNLIPLSEVLAEVHQVGAGSKRVQQSYDLLLTCLGSELAILQDVPLEEIEAADGPLLAEGIRRMRTGALTIAAGYDGEYGVIRLFDEQERDLLGGQMSLFGKPEPKKPKPAPPQSLETEPKALFQKQAAESASQWQQTGLFGPPIDAEAAPTTNETGLEATSPFLAGLNPQQREAVLTTDSSLVIVAGPGTGKTRTLTYRIAYLVTEKGVAPEHVLAITFTNKAAEEMAQRLRALLGEAVSNQITIKTFHAFGAMLLRAEGEAVSLTSDFAVIGEDERRTLLKRDYPDLSETAINRYLQEISMAKNQLLTPDSPDLTETNGYDDVFVDIYREYEARLRQHQLLDFDDLILQAVQLFEINSGILAKYQNRFRWISVDEYQDLNFAQYRLLRLLTGPGTNLCAIGDPDQAIYGFRGASSQFFQQFSRDFAPVETLHLSQNYRSTQLILNASEQVIEKSPLGERVKIWSDFVDKTKVTIYQAPSDRAEAEYTVHEIEKMVGGTSYFSLDSGRVDDDGAGRSFADFAVLYRLSAQSQSLIEAFQRSGIPYQTVGQTSLVEYKDIRTLLACLWFLYNPKITFHLEQIAAKKQMQTIISFLAAIEDNTIKPVPVLIEQIQQFLAERSILSFDEKGSERLQQLRWRATPFENRLGEFLESMALQKEADAYDPRADRVTLMTLHAAKGLEFPVVFIVGCEEKLLPYQRAGTPLDLEEERRLFYVGMTRAGQKLILTHVKSRYLFGQPMNNPPSRYLDDIEQALKEIKQSTHRKSARETPDHIQLKLF